MYFLYSVLMGLAALLTAPYWLVQGLRCRKYLSNLWERLGFSLPELEKLPAERPGAIWIHAVSVGEALSGVALAKALKEKYTQRPLIVSTTTRTGYALAKERMPSADAVIYFPFDWAFCVRRVLNAVKPALVLILETELWPNFLRESKRRGVPVVFVSGRISDRSFARYERFLRLFGFFLRPLLGSALGNAAAFLMQTGTDAERIRASMKSQRAAPIVLDSAFAQLIAPACRTRTIPPFSTLSAASYARLKWGLATARTDGCSPCVQSLWV